MSQPTYRDTPGSETARKASADFQKTKDQGGGKPSKSKGDGKSKGKNEREDVGRAKAGVDCQSRP